MKQNSEVSQKFCYSWVLQGIPKKELQAFDPSMELKSQYESQRSVKSVYERFVTACEDQDQELVAQLMRICFDFDEDMVSSNISPTSQVNTGSKCMF